MALDLGGLPLVAFSISGLATYVMAPSLDAVFDLGHCPAEAARLRNVFLSHCHQDHAGAVPRHVSLRAMQTSRPSRVWCPEESAAGLTVVLRAWQRLEERRPEDVDGVVRGVAAGASVELGRRYTVRAFDVAHRIASRGYTVVENRNVLLPQYQGMPGAEIHAARLRGEMVTELRPHPVLTYVGDSTPETLVRHPEVGDSDVLFLEATHLPGTTREASARWGHTHLDDLVELARTHPRALAARHVVIKHFSMKYDEAEVRRAVEALPEELRRRVTMLVHA